MTREKRIAIALAKCLRVRLGDVLTPEIIEDRARNGVHYVLEALRDEAEEATPAGHDIHGETAEQHAERVIK